MIMLALAILAADPSSLTSVLAAAKPGDTVRLVAGRYGPVRVKARTFDPPIEIDATAATLASVDIAGSTGVHWTGGTFAGDAAAAVAVGNGFSAHTSRDISIKAARFTDYRMGIVLSYVDGATVANNWLAHLSADGINISMSRRMIVDRNACSDFEPGPGEHPDCIQLWSRRDAAPTADIVITANSVVGAIQGISLFNHGRGGVDDGGFDRIRISRNNVLITASNGIAVYDCRGCSVTNNSINSLPNYVNRAQLYVTGGSVERCGNDVPMVPRQGSGPCPSGG